MDGTTALVPRNEPVRIVPISTFHMSSVCSSKPTRKLAPALLHRIEIGPNSCSVAATAAVHSSAWRTSSRTASERPSLATISAATASALSTNRSATHTAAPSLANNRAWVPPIAPPPPVITAVLPSSFTILDYQRIAAARRQRLVIRLLPRRGWIGRGQTPYRVGTII